VVDVVVVVVDGVVVDEFPLGNLSSSSLQIPWKKQSITFCLSLFLASFESVGRAVVVVVVVVVVATDSVVGLVYTSFCEKSQPIPRLKQSLSNSVDESRLCGGEALLLDAAVVVVVVDVVGVVVVDVVVVVGLEVVAVVVVIVVVTVVATTLESAIIVEDPGDAGDTVVDAGPDDDVDAGDARVGNSGDAGVGDGGDVVAVDAGDGVVVNLNGELPPLPLSWNSIGRLDSVRVLSKTGVPDEVSSCNLLRSTC